MNVDPTGTLFWLIFAGVLLSGLFSGVSCLINASEDKNKWGAFLGGFVLGTAVGFLLELEINGKSIIDHIRDAVYDFWKWLWG